MEPKIILWDIDGVLVAVSESYRQSIVDTVQHYFSHLIGMPLKERLMSWEDTQHFKMAGGFNDDWELTYAAVLCFLAGLLRGVDVAGIGPEKAPSSLDEMASALSALGSKVNNKKLKVDLSSVTRQAKAAGGGASSIEKTLSSSFGDLGAAKKFLFPELIKRVFEEMYLGDDLFKEKYGVEARFFHGEGLIKKEKPLVSLAALLELRKKYYQGIVTGRERFEAEHSLKQHGLLRMFPSEVIVTREDTIKRKPSPEPLIECKERICRKYALSHDSGVIYIGDSLDDLAAARKAGFFFIALVGAVEGEEERNNLRLEFHDKICDLIVDDVKELFLYL